MPPGRERKGKEGREGKCDKGRKGKERDGVFFHATRKRNKAEGRKGMERKRGRIGDKGSEGEKCFKCYPHHY